MASFKKKNDITLENLARMINRGFDKMKLGMNENFNEVNERLIFVN